MFKNERYTGNSEDVKDGLTILEKQMGLVCKRTAQNRNRRVKGSLYPELERRKSKEKEARLNLGLFHLLPSFLKI